MNTRKKSSHLLLTIFLSILLVLPPLSNTANAYGNTNHEKVVDAGEKHFVVLKENGTVWSWGDNTYGQLGANEFSPSSSKPAAIRKKDGSQLSDIKSIAAGGYHSVALDQSGAVWTWGRNDWGQLGQDKDKTTLPINNDPQKVNIGPVKAISAGEQHSLAVDTQGRVWAWGYNKYGQLGQCSEPATDCPDPIEFSVKPILVSGLSDVIAVAAGANHSIALTRNGEVWAWGRGTDGQIGNGQSKHVNPSPVKVSLLSDIMEIAAGDNHTLALKQDRTTIYAWGSNRYGQLGDGGYDEKLEPVQVKNISGVKMIAAGNDHTIAVKDNGTVWTWGRNTSGKQTVRTSPIQLQGVSNAIAIGGGGGGNNSYSLVVSQDGSLYYWDQTTSHLTTELPIVTRVNGLENVMQNTEYPYVQGGQVVFYYYGNASNVEVVGDFNDWSELPLKDSGNNEWSLQLKDIPAGTYNYQFVVDGERITDPLNRLKGFNERGDTLSVLRVPAYATTSPIIKDKEVTFTYNSYDYNGQLEFDAETTYVAVRGSFNGFVDIPLVKQPNNTWAVTEIIEPKNDVYYYYYVVRDNNVPSNKVEEERLDPLNLNIDYGTTGQKPRNTFKVEEKLSSKVPVTGIELNVSEIMDLVVGEKYAIRATVLPTNATNKIVNWSSSKPNIVSVENGELTAHAAGEATIVASTADGGKMALVTVQVFPQDNAVSYPRVGYKEMDDKLNVKSNKVWYVNFNEAVDLSSVNARNVYVLKDNGVEIPVGYQLSNDNKTLEIHLLSGKTYTPGGTYYLFIEDTVKTKHTNQKLSEKVQMKFTIEL